MGKDTGGVGAAADGLPHTRTRAAHWVVTTVVLAAVVGALTLVEPGEVAATGSTGRAVPGPAPDPSAASYPLNCAGGPVVVARKVSADLDADGRLETVAAVHCQAGSGTPPHALFVLSAGSRPHSAPRLMARLIDARERMSVVGLAVRGHTLTARLVGYSSPDVPSCCPDRQGSASWQWNSGQFRLVPQSSQAVI